MSIHREQLILASVLDANLPPEFAKALQTQCPWLDAATEVSASLGPELLAEQMASAQLSVELVERFLHAYNARVRAEANPLESLQCEAFAAVSAALVGQGRADPFGEGDYWVNSDSFSTRSPSVVVFEGFRFTDKAIQSLQGVLSGYASAYSELRISSEEGGEVLTLYPR